MEKMTISKYDEANIEVYTAIPENARVLDVGCATGKLGARLKKEKQPSKLVGMEIESSAAKKADKFYDEVLLVDLEKISRLPFPKRFFNCIILADILEHLRGPENLLKILSPYLSDDGVLVISVPNIAFFLNRIYLLLGRFEYQEKGILDKSHLRFFTLSSIKKLVKDSGYQIISAKGYIITRPILKFIDIFARLFPTIFAYQFLIVAHTTKKKL